MKLTSLGSAAIASDAVSNRSCVALSHVSLSPIPLAVLKSCNAFRERGPQTPSAVPNRNPSSISRCCTCLAASTWPRSSCCEDFLRDRDRRRRNSGLRRRIVRLFARWRVSRGCRTPAASARGYEGPRLVTGCRQCGRRRHRAWAPDRRDGGGSDHTAVALDAARRDQQGDRHTLHWWRTGNCTGTRNHEMTSS